MQIPSTMPRMDTTTADLKQIVAKHFDYAPHGTGQYFHGDYFTPKHADSLSDLLDEVIHSWQADSDESLEKELEEAKKEIEKLEEKISDAENALA